MLILSLALSLQPQATIWQGCNCCLVCLHACGRSGGGQGRGGWIAAQNRQGLLSQLTARNVAPKKEAARRATQGENCGSQKLAYTQMKVTADHLR